MRSANFDQTSPVNGRPVLEIGVSSQRIRVTHDPLHAFRFGTPVALPCK